MNIYAWMAGAVVALFTIAVLFTAGWEAPPMDSVQSGYRGTGMAQIYNPRMLAEQIPENQMPEPLDPSSGGPPASTVYQNVEVLGHLSLLEFNRLMQAMTNWVSPEEGCAYCHNEENYASDEVYTKLVTRNMLYMTQEINSQWEPHVAQTGVTCYTCHRGQPVPENYWYHGGNGAGPYSDMVGGDGTQNQPAVDIGLTSLPVDPFSAYMEDDQDVRVIGDTALPTGKFLPIQDAEETYSLMVHWSESLGVNCTFCHNSRAFAQWDESSPQRVTSWHGLRMVQSINTNWVATLEDVFPENRKGPHGDPYKVNCATCHQGAYKPMYGAPMLKDYPNLAKPGPSAASLIPAGSLNESEAVALAED